MLIKTDLEEIFDELPIDLTLYFIENRAKMIHKILKLKNEIVSQICQLIFH